VLVTYVDCRSWRDASFPPPSFGRCEAFRWDLDGIGYGDHPPLTRRIRLATTHTGAGLRLCAQTSKHRQAHHGRKVLALSDGTRSGPTDAVALNQRRCPAGLMRRVLPNSQGGALSAAPGQLGRALSKASGSEDFRGSELRETSCDGERQRSGHPVRLPQPMGAGGPQPMWITT